MPEKLITLKKIIKDYQTGEVVTHVLKGIDLEVKKGEFIAIMGPSGSGKSTLMHILGLLDRPSSGSYILRKKDITSFNEDELAHLRNKEFGFVFQAFNLLPRTSVLENVMLPLMYNKSKNKEQRSLEIIKKVGLGHRVNHVSNQLSGGEKQRVAVARALVNAPALIFADEPTGNLDSKNSEQIMDLFTQIHKEGNTIIMVTHEDETAAYANRIIRLKDGEIISDKSQ